MSDTDREVERLEVAKIAAQAAEMAASNIRSYLTAQAEAALGPSVSRVMKIADDLSAEMRDVVTASAKLAHKSLLHFLEEEERNAP